MIQRVTDNGVFWAQQNLENTGVRIKTAWIDDGIFSTVEVGDLFL